MGTSIPPHSSSRSFHDPDQPMVELFQQHKRTIGIVVAALVVLIGGGWFYLSSKSLKEERALQSYRTAMQSVFSGNAQLAKSDLDKLIVRYNGTVAGTEGALALAKLHYDEGKYQEGLDVLKKAKPVSDMAYDAHVITAAGYEGLGKFDDAGAEYELAAKAARFETERDVARANAARAYQAGTKRDQALAIWKELAEKVESPAAAEARVRVGELEAAPIKI